MPAAAAGTAITDDAARSLTNPVADQKPKSIMQSLGEFVGHIAEGIRTDPTKREVSRTVEETRRDDGVILRRTVIEEVELRPGTKPPQPEAETKDETNHARD